MGLERKRAAGIRLCEHRRGSVSVSNTPAQVGGLSGVKQVAAGLLTSIALKSDGTVWAWGDNASGELGTGTSATASGVPIQVAGLPLNIVAVAAGGSHFLARTANGGVWTWGDNRDGQLGNGTTTPAPTPTPGLVLNGVSGIAAGQFHSLALMANGTVDAWGRTPMVSSV